MGLLRTKSESEWGVISNERVQALIATDREALVALMAVAVAASNWGGHAWDIALDPDIKALLDAARAANARPATQTTVGGWTIKRSVR